MLGVAVLVCLVWAGLASAATYDVWAGPGYLSAPPAGAPKMMAPNLFFPSKLQVHVGDSVRFRSADFHTATYLGSTSISTLPIFTRDPANGTYSGINDAAGTPFYFNGLPKFVYNPAALAPAGSAAIVKGTLSSSGVLSKSGWKVTFSKTGTYVFNCLVHPMMKISITVKAKKARIPSAASVRANMAKELAFAVKTATVLDKTVPSDPTTVYVGVGKSVPGGSVEIMGFRPQVLKIKAGTTVTFLQNSPMEPHDMVFGPPDWVKNFLQTTDLIPQGPGAPNQVEPVFFYGTDPTSAPYVYSGSNHGNGFLATPLLGPPGTPLPKQFQITFTKPGVYKYICGLHGPDMNGEIDVS